MRQRKLLLTMAFMLYLTISALSQETPVGYNPFIPANLDDPAKMPVLPVVESSYHYYSVFGDIHYNEVSTFVWYVENGTMGTYDPVTDVWIPATGTIAISNGEYLELPGSGNNSDIWVRWNDGTGGNSTGYIAVYERSADNCIFDHQITGYKHNILVPPEIWFLVDAREECSDQVYSISAQLNELHTNSFPYKLTYSYPGPDGLAIQTDTTFFETDLDGANRLNWDLTGVQDLDYTNDEIYVISLDALRDNYGSDGNIAPLGAAANQYPLLTITIFHLPQTGGMTMD